MIENVNNATTDLTLNQYKTERERDVMVSLGNSLGPHPYLNDTTLSCFDRCRNVVECFMFEENILLKDVAQKPQESCLFQSFL